MFNRTHNPSISTVAALILLFAVSACSAQSASDSVGGDAYADDSTYDYLEPFNRAMFSVNMTLDGMVVKPVTQVYRFVPQWGRNRVSNFLDNMSAPISFTNSVLQLDPENAFTVFWRFVFNTTLGVGGLFDIATELGVPQSRKEDFGQTLGHYGIGPNGYIVLPFIGPSTTRDSIGRAVDFFGDPFYYALEEDEIYARIAATAIDSRSRIMPAYDNLIRDSVDPYATIRSLYMQKRAADIANSKSKSYEDQQ